MAQKTKPPVWKMPAHLERFRDMVNNTGGNSIEELMNDHSSDVFNNAPRALLCVAVKSQIALLERLYKEGCLRDTLTLPRR